MEHQMECVYDCRHPIWGSRSEGVCEAGTCSCGSGYTPFDALGSPSCVSVAALRIIYCCVLVIGLTMMVFMLWHAGKDRHLSAASKRSRRAILRRRVMIPTSIYVAGTTLVVALAVARIHNGLFSSVNFAVWYGIALPTGNFACTLGAEVWVEALPSQLLPADSIATKLKIIAEKYSVFIVMASLLMGSMVFLACLAPAFGIRSMSRVINLMSIFTCSSACACILFVGIIISRVIRKTKRTAPEASKRLYTRASEQLWVQVRFLCGMGVVWVSSTSALELTSGGQKTPSIPLAVMFVDGCIMLSSIVHFSKLENSGAYATMRPRAALSRLLSNIKDPAHPQGLSGHQPGASSLKAWWNRSAVSIGSANNRKPMSTPTSTGASTQKKSSKVVPV